MKAKLLVLSCVLALTACDKLGQQALDSIPNPSPAQEQVAQQAYQAFTQGDFPQLYTYFEPELQREFKTHEKDMRKFAKSIPKQAITTQKIVSKHIEKSTEKPSLYAVTYEYAYSNKNLVQYDVGFDKAGGNTKIRSFDVKLYGASTD